MKTIIAGSRVFGPRPVQESNQQYAVRVVLPHVESALYVCPFTSSITRVVCGMAAGVDRAGWLWANTHNLPIDEFPADWNEHGKQAGFIRNTAMAIHADALVAVWDGQSRGTKHMIDIARTYGLQVFIWRVS